MRTPATAGARTRTRRDPATAQRYPPMASRASDVEMHGKSSSVTLHIIYYRHAYLCHALAGAHTRTSPRRLWPSHALDFTPIAALPSRLRAISPCINCPSLPLHSLAALPRPSPPLLSPFTSHAHRRARERLSAAIPPRLTSLLYSLPCPSRPPHTLVFTLIAVLPCTRFPSLPLDTRPSRPRRHSLLYILLCPHVQFLHMPA